MKRRSRKTISATIVRRSDKVRDKQNGHTLWVADIQGSTLVCRDYDLNGMMVYRNASEVEPLK